MQKIHKLSRLVSIESCLMIFCSIQPKQRYQMLCLQIHFVALPKFQAAALVGCELLCKRRVNGRMKCTLQRQKTEYAYSFNVLTCSKIVLDINSIKKYCIPHSIEISSTTALKKIHSRYLEAKVS